MNNTEIVETLVSTLAPSLNKTLGTTNASLISLIFMLAINVIQLIFHIRSSTCCGKKVLELETDENARPRSTSSAGTAPTTPQEA